MTSRFCIDEARFFLDLGLEETPSEVLQRLLDLVEQCQRDQQEVQRWSELETVEVLPGVPLWAMLYEEIESLALDRDLRRSLQLLLDRCRFWDQPSETADSQQLIVDGHPGVFLTLAHAFRENQAGRAVACIGLRRDVSGVRSVVSSGQSCQIHFLAETGPALFAYYRDIPEIEGHDRSAYFHHAAIAFPALYFVPELAQEFNAFAGPYAAVRKEVSRQLGALNDHFQEVFLRHQGQPKPTAQEMKARFNVIMSKESSNTRGNKKAARERAVVVDGIEISCEWHCKLSRTANRIHFHPGSSKVVDGRIVIGRFARHLPT